MIGAAVLGLSRWDLFVNMGISLLENGNLKAATDALQHAVGLDPSRPESHFNLGLVYERRDMLTEAEQEMRATLRLEPGDLDARNMLGVIYARQGNATRASVEWRDLLQDAPDYSPARANLMMFPKSLGIGMQTGRYRGGAVQALGHSLPTDTIVRALGVAARCQLKTRTRLSEPRAPSRIRP